MSDYRGAVVKVDFNNIGQYQMYLSSLINQMEAVIYNVQAVASKLVEMIDFSKTPPSGPVKEYEVLTKYIDEMQKVLNSFYDMQYAASKYVMYYDELGVYEDSKLVYDEQAVDDILNKFESSIYDGEWYTRLEQNDYSFEIWENGILCGVDFIDSEREQAVRYNKQILDQLNEDLGAMKIGVIHKAEELRDSSNVYKMNIKPLADGVTINSILQAFSIEDIDYQILKAQTETLGGVKENLGNINGDKIEVIKEMYEDLIDEGLFDNFLNNCQKQIEAIGFEDFIADDNRIKWLAQNPKYEVNNFRSNLTPEQFRLLTEEVAYLLFHNDKDKTHPKFNEDFYKALITGEGDIKINIGEENEYIMNIKHRFIDAGLVFEAVESPSGESPWYIQENGLEACVLRVNGEIVILYPGSQEIKEDWINTNIVPNLTHKIPEQYEIASDFAAEVKAAYPGENIILCGHSLAGGAVSYAGAKNDLNSFAIDPAPSIEGIDYPDYDKGITIIPGGKFGGVLNDVTVDSDGYNKSDTEIDALNGLISIATNIPPGGSMLSVVNKYGQNNDKPANNEAVYINSVNEKTDIDDPENPGYYDNYNGYIGDHMSGNLDEELAGLYIPYD